MKKRGFLFAFTAAFFFLAAPLFSQEGTGFNEEYPYYDSDDDCAPCISHFNVRGKFDAICKSNFKKNTNLPGQKIGFSEGETTFGYVCCLNSCEGLVGEIGYSTTVLRWRDNPSFREDHFNNLILGFGAFTKRIPCWLWQAKFTAYIDTRELSLADYTIYNVAAWGRYSYCHNVGFHVGFLGWAGIEKNWALPIIGIDFKPNRNWKINLVYPVNVSAAYYLTNCFSVSLNGKIFNSRHRVGKHEALSQGIFEYRNTGAEFALNYEYCNFASANVHFGSTTGGELKITNQCDRQPAHRRFRDACYIGGGFDLKF